MPASPRFQGQIRLIPTSHIWSAADRYALDDWDKSNMLAIASSLANPESGGLINPIILSKDENETGRHYRLRAGGHRLAAFKHNASHSIPCPHSEYDDWTCIPARIGTGFSESSWLAREDAENFIRRTIPWFIRARKIHDHHARMLRETVDRERWTPRKTALLLDIAKEEVRLSYEIIELFLSSDKADSQIAFAIQDARSLNAANAIAKRHLERKKEAERETRMRGEPKDEGQKLDTKEQKVDLGEGIWEVGGVKTATTKTEPKEAITLTLPPSSPTTHPLIHTSLEAFTSSYSGPRFNLIHVDPPYSVGRDSGSFQYSRQDKPSYSDDKDALWSYLISLSLFVSKHAASSCHLIIWFPVDLNKLRSFDALELFPAFRLDPTPFIWNRSGAKGIAPAPNYSGRKTYEWAVILSSGSRKIVRVLPMGLEASNNQETRIHESEKPFSVVRHLCSMYVDASTIAIDPTAGSGRPLQAIHSLGAHSVLGLEQEQSIFDLAVNDWSRYLASQENELL